jgi:hypothetical protein
MKLSYIITAASLLSISTTTAYSAPIVMECSIGKKFSSGGVVMVFSVDLENRFIAYGTGSTMSVPIVEVFNRFIVAHDVEWRSGRPMTTTIVLDIENMKMRETSIGTGGNGDYASAFERECR